MRVRGLECGRRGRTTAVTAAVLATVLAWGAAGVGAAPRGTGTLRPFNLSVGSDHGSGVIDAGLSCAEGGDGGYWHYDYEAGLPAGVVTGPQSTLPGSLRLHLDLHSEDKIVRATPAEPGAGEAWLQGTESTVTFANQRGTVGMQLTTTGRGCDNPHGLAFDGTNATGPATWKITEATGAYRQAAGSGTASLSAAVAPGADNPFTIQMSGKVGVLQPSLKLEPIDSYWAFLGAHYLLRRVTVVYRVTNTGPGDAFGVRLVAANSPTSGVKLVGPIPFDTNTTALGPVPQSLGDLRVGESEIVRLRWQLPKPVAGNPPCQTVILGCVFDSRLTFEMPDALDVVQANKSATVTYHAPNFPPPGY